MKNYLSMGFGVNSVALYLLMQDMGVDFEAVFVDHGGDWPETYEYAEYFINTGRPVTVLVPQVKNRTGSVFTSIVQYCKEMNLTPSRSSRWCTDRFKVVPIYKYIEAPCFMHIGFAADEAGRAVLNTRKGVENRFLLIEHGIDRKGCANIIKAHGLNLPRKSGCFICPFQGRAEYRELRKKHPDLFCEANKIEAAQNNRITADGRPWKPYFLAGSKPLEMLVTDEELAQMYLPGLEELEYPPCQCGL